MATGWQHLERNGQKNWYNFDLKNGKMLTGLQKLNWSKGTNTFYFLEDGSLVVDKTINNNSKYYTFDKTDCFEKGLKFYY